MIANYGYADAEGEFYITIDTSKCAECVERPCLPVCPASLYVEEEDPYGEQVIAVADEARRQLKYLCAPCKPHGTGDQIPCILACPYKALSHSW